jgi:peptidoglycan/LPS O-acetylase OafA/YrhL
LEILLLKYRPEIDGLRAVAVIPVILFHAGFSIFRGGFVGVDVFFVISGYLITNIIYDEVSAGEFSILRFYERRARRILPALFLVCLVCIPFAYFWMLPGELKDFSRSLMAVNLFVSNIYFLRGSGYFAAAAELKPLFHTWSLAIEEQFYIFFPPLLLLLRNLSRRSLGVLIGVLSLGSLAIAEYGSWFHPSANFFLLPSRAWELGVGALLALLLGGNRLENRVIQQVGSLAGLCLIGFAVISFDEHTRFPSLWALIPVIGTALVIACSGGGEVVGRILSLKPIVGIGLISYSAYLWHQPLFAITRIRSVSDPTTTTYIFLILATLFLAFLSWKLVEQPFRSRRTVTVRTLIAWTAPIGLFLLALGTTGHVTRGLLSSNPPLIAELEKRLVLNWGLSPVCEGKFTLSRECRTSEEPEILVWGDSFAMHLVDGVVASRLDVRLIQHTKTVCGPFVDVAPVSRTLTVNWAETCLKFNEQVIDYVTSSKTIKYAILSSPFMQYVGKNSRVLHNGKVTDSSVDFIAEQVEKTVKRLSDLGVKAIVFAPPPSEGKDIGRCLVKAVRWGELLSTCNIEKSTYRAMHRNVLALFEKLEILGVDTFSFDEFLCEAEYCITSKEGLFLYRDGGHLSKEGSSFLGKNFDFVRLFKQD